MHSPISYVQLQENPGQFSSVRDVTFSESGAGQAFSRGVEEVDSILCPMRTNEITEDHLQQPTVPFHNPFHDSRFKKRSVVIVVNHGINDHPLHLPVRTETQNDKPASAYVPENERFSIQSILGLGQSSPQNSSLVDNNPGQKSDESCPLPIQRQTNRYQNDPTYAQRERERASANRKKLGKDPAYAQRVRERARERIKELRKDPAYVERQREYYRNYYKNNPANVERRNTRQRERYQNDPDFAERRNTRQRERYRNDPAYAQRIRELAREKSKKLRKDPAYLQRERERQRERYQNDPAYAQRRRERQRERYQNDPAFAQRRREHAREKRKKLCKDPA